MVTAAAAASASGARPPAPVTVRAAGIMKRLGMSACRRIMVGAVRATHSVRADASRIMTPAATGFLREVPAGRINLSENSLFHEAVFFAHVFAVVLKHSFPVPGARVRCMEDRKAAPLFHRPFSAPFLRSRIIKCFERREARRRGILGGVRSTEAIPREHFRQMAGYCRFSFRCPAGRTALFHHPAK